MSGVQMSRILLNVDDSAEVDTRRTKALSLYADGPVRVPSRYELNIGHTVTLTLADEATVRAIRDACDQLLTLPAPDEIDSMLPAPAGDDSAG